MSNQKLPTYDDESFIDLNEGINDMPSGGLMIEESDGTKRPATQDDIDEYLGVRRGQNELERQEKAGIKKQLRKQPTYTEDDDVPPSKYYLQVQRELALEREERQALRERGWDARRKFPLYPGDRYERITLVQHDWQDGLFNRIHRGWWIAKCDCGATVRVHTRDLRIKARQARACAKCLETMPKRAYNPAHPPGRPKSKRTYHPDRPPGRPRKRLEGMVFGRLTVRMWCQGLGWLCECSTCGGQEVCPTTQMVLRRGMIGCDGSCVPA